MRNPCLLISLELELDELITPLVNNYNSIEWDKGLKGAKKSGETEKLKIKIRNKNTNLFPLPTLSWASTVK